MTGKLCQLYGGGEGVVEHKKAKRAGAASTNLAKSQKVAHIGHDERGNRQGQVV